MTDGAGINLATVGTAELEAMSVQIFTSCLEKMSGDAIVRFRRMRKLSSSHKQALERFLNDHPEKRPKHDAIATSVVAEKSEPVARGTKRTAASTFKRRLRAWWEGVEFTPEPAVDNASGGGPVAKVEPPLRKKAAPVPPPSHAMTRIDMLQRLWGEGFGMPGGEKFALRLTKDIAFNGGQPCLDLKAGLGGAMRAVARRHNVTVEGLESDPETAAAGRQLSQHLGVGKKASIRAGDMLTEKFEDGRYGAIFARELMFALPEREALLARLHKALAPGGALAITDYVLDDGAEENPNLAAWQAAEPTAPRPATMGEYRETLASLGLSIGEYDDLSSEYISFIHAGWKQMHRSLQSALLPPETATMLMNEGNLWLARSQALENGGLRLLHFVARHQAEVSQPATR